MIKDFNMPQHKISLSIFYVIFLSIFSCQYLFANKPNVINFTPKMYGAANKNWSIGSDENGVLYVGNDKGLLEFDGVEWILHKLPSKGIIRSLGVLNNNTIFTGGTEDFGVWQREVSGNLKYRSLSAQINGLQNNDFWKLFVVKEGVFFQSFSAIFYYNFKTKMTSRLNKIVAPILLLNKVRNELLYQQMNSAVYKLVNNKSEKLPGSEIFEGTNLRVILPYGKSGYLFASTSKGLIVYENGQYHDFNVGLSHFFQNKEINTGVITSRNTYILGTLLDGVYEIAMNGKIINHFSFGNVLPNNTVLSMWQQDDQNLWLGLDKGISIVSYKPDLSFYTNGFESIGSVYCASYWGENLYVGTNQGVFAISKTALNSNTDNYPIQFVKGTEGQVWNLKIIDNQLFCCHNNGILSIENGTSKRFLPLNFGVNNITKEKIDDVDYYVLFTYQGVKFYNPATKKIFNPLGISDPIFNVEVDHLDNIWMEQPVRGVYKCRWHFGNKNFSAIKYYGGNSSRNLPFSLSFLKLEEE